MYYRYASLVNILTNTIPHFLQQCTDKPREVARQKRLEEVIRAGGKNAKEIKAEQRKADKERRIVERREQAIDKGRNPDKKRGRHAQLVDEWDDLAKEERLYKKLRKKQITQDEYNNQMQEI
jgi:ATP-dependent RNA helicase DDX55/SPB4